MGTRRKRKEKGRPPMSAAGLMTFFGEDIRGIKIRPEMVVLFSIVLIVGVILAHTGIFSP